MDSIEINKLMAEYEGWIHDGHGSYQNPEDDGDWWTLDNMMFDTSWKWLMPIVEKIEETEIEGDYPVITIWQSMCEIEAYEYLITHERSAFQAESKMKAVVDAVVSYLTWLKEWENNNGRNNES